MTKKAYKFMAIEIVVLYDSICPDLWHMVKKTNMYKNFLFIFYSVRDR